MLLRFREDLKREIGSRQPDGVLFDLLPTEQQFEPADAPSQLADHGWNIGG